VQGIEGALIGIQERIEVGSPPSLRIAVQTPLPVPAGHPDGLGMDQIGQPKDSRGCATAVRLHHDLVSLVWPYDVNADHNAGFSTRTTTIINVERLPPGMTDINLLEAGWGYMDERKIVVYGAIDPVPNIPEKLDAPTATLSAASRKDSRNRMWKAVLIGQLELVEWWVKCGRYDEALKMVEDRLLRETDVC
jgi:hypothetical protein